MFDHTTLRVSSLSDYAPRFEPVMAALGIKESASSSSFAFWKDFALSEIIADRPQTLGAHLAFVAPSTEHVDAFHAAGLEAGLNDNGAPGPRPYTEDYYGAFLLDEAGNNFEAVHRPNMRQGGIIDHIGMRVEDVAASTAFYRTVGEAVGFGLIRESPESAMFASPTGAILSISKDEYVTKNLHIAFGGTDDAVDSFHQAATDAGYRDNGAPGERPQYHDGFYAAYVLDPDGNNIEVCNHHR